MEEARRKQKM